MNAAPYSRRAVLQALATSGILLGLDAAWAGGETCGASLAGELDPKAVGDLGREYRAAHPEDSGMAGIISLLAAGGSVEKTCAELGALAQADFEAGRMINLSGWFVSTTEGRVFAALAI